MVKVFKCWRFRPIPSFYKFCSWNTRCISFRTEADLLEWLVNFLVSIPEKFKTVIIHLDTVDADSPRWGPMILINMFANTEIIICVKWDKFNWGLLLIFLTVSFSYWSSCFFQNENYNQNYAKSNILCPYNKSLGLLKC